MYFEEVYDRYSDKIYRKCFSFVKDRATAEDFMHDIFLKIILNLSNFKETSKFSTYVYSITYNYCIDSIRQSKKIQETDLENYDFADADEGWAEAKEMEEKKLNKALDSLSTQERSIILMKYQDNMSIKEISEALNLQESAVKMRLLRTKDKIKKLYVDTIIFWTLLISKLLFILKK